MMVLTALLSDRQLERVRAATPSLHRVRETRTLGHARRILQTEPIDALIVDPRVGNEGAIDGSATELFSIGADYPYLPVVFYVSQPVDALKLVAQFPSRERCEALVVGVDDEPTLLGAAIDSVVGSSSAGRLLGALGAAIAPLPPSLRRALRLVFSHPRFFRNADDLACMGCMSRRNLDRWLARCGLVSSGELLEVARAFVALRLKRDMFVGARDLHAAIGFAEASTSTHLSCAPWPQAARRASRQATRMPIQM